VAGRACLDAVVAPVEAVTHGRTKLNRDRSRSLGPGRQATTSVEDSGSNEGSGGTSREAGFTGSAVAPHGLVGLEEGVGHHGAKEKPWTKSRSQHHGVLAPPTEPGSNCGGTVHQAVVVAQNLGLVTLTAEACRQPLEGLSEWLVGVIDRHPGDPATSPGSGTSGAGQVRTGADQEAHGPGKAVAGRGGNPGIAIGESESGRLTVAKPGHQILVHVGKGICGSHPEKIEACFLRLFV
jgi:hypothetical protein